MEQVCICIVAVFFFFKTSILHGKHISVQIKKSHQDKPVYTILAFLQVEKWKKIAYWQGVQNDILDMLTSLRGGPDKLL